MKTRTLIIAFLLLPFFLSITLQNTTTIHHIIKAVEELHTDMEYSMYTHTEEEPGNQNSFDFVTLTITILILINIAAIINHYTRFIRKLMFLLARFYGANYVSCSPIK